MAKEHILFDKTEILVMVFMGNKAAMKSLKYDDIISITIKPYSEKTLFGAKPSELIEIKPKSGSVISFTKSKEKAFWDKYKQGLTEFAKNNRISLFFE